jgi:outer membrane lipoprotein
MGSFLCSGKTSRRFLIITGWLALLPLVIGCMNHYSIPAPLKREINRSVTFTDLKRDPEAHKGKVVALGGLVLRAKNLKEGTRIEILQLPLDSFDQPDFPLEDSQGRFMVLDPDHHDPVVLKDRRITVIGEVIGKVVEAIDEFDYTYPYVSARLIHIWPDNLGYDYAYPYSYWPYAYYPYMNPWYGYPLWYYGLPPSAVPPQDQVPPRRFNSPSGKQSSPPNALSAKRKIEGRSR